MASDVSKMGHDCDLLTLLLHRGCWRRRCGADGRRVQWVSIMGDWYRQVEPQERRSAAASLGSVPWVTDPRGFGQITYVCTIQGFECDLPSVILRPGSGSRGREVDDAPRVQQGPSLRGRKATDDQADCHAGNCFGGMF